MRPLEAPEIRRGADYDAVRAEARRAMVSAKQPRRVLLGDFLAVVFENRETVRSAIEEVLRAERVTDVRRIDEEIAAFNTVVPRDGELSASLYYEISDPAELSIRLEELEGVEERLYLEVGVVRVDAISELRPGAEGIPPVHHLRFPVGEARLGWAGGAEVAVGVDHRGHQCRVVLEPNQRAILLDDLSG